MMFFAPIFVLFFQDLGLSMTQVMITQSVYTAVVMFTVIPAGIIADFVGRKKVMIVNAVLFILSWLLFAISDSFVGILMAEIVIALSSSAWIAAGTPLFYDSLREINKENQFKKLFGNVVGINYIMFGLSSLAGGYIATAFGFRMTYWIAAKSAIIPAGITVNITTAV